MTLPTYNKADRRKTFEILPKGAYVIRLMGAKEEQNKSGNGRHLTIIFDIAEGEYKGFYGRMFENDTSEDKKWPNDATYRLNVPDDGSQDWVYKNWNSFFADLEDSNGGFVFNGDVKSLKNKLLGGKFRNEQSEYNGNIYDHTRLQWTCVADDVRKGKPGRMPADKLMEGGGSGRTNPRKPSGSASEDIPDFMKVPDDAGDDGIPF